MYLQGVARYFIFSQFRDSSKRMTVHLIPAKAEKGCNILQMFWEWHRQDSVFAVEVGRGFIARDSRYVEAGP